MSSSLKQYYLHHLGIETWVLRDNHPAISDTSASAQSIEHELSQLNHCVAVCQRCPLHQTRTQAVFARGNPQAALMIVGEAPGYHEDQQGLPFVGKAGHLLNQMLRSIGFDEQAVYIANVLKCRPPQNRDPLAEEILACGDYLKQQINLVKPQLILALGRFAGQFFVKNELALYKMRGQRYEFEGIPVLVSYHPAYLLRRPEDKKKAYQDLIAAACMLQKIHLT